MLLARRRVWRRHRVIGLSALCKSVTSLAALGAALLALGGAGCATPANAARRAPGFGSERAVGGCATGRVFTQEEVRARTASLAFGDNSYAEVNSAWLERFHTDFRTELFRQGIVRADERFDCNRYAEFFIGLAQVRFYREAFHSQLPAEALALAPYWYVRGDGRGSHAVVQALTERGRLFIDPQTGAEVYLTPQEHATAFYRFF